MNFVTKNKNYVSNLDNEFWDPPQIQCQILKNETPKLSHVTLNKLSSYKKSEIIKYVGSYIESEKCDPKFKKNINDIVTST